MTNATISLAVDLPASFRAADVLDFHRRDPSGLAEQVGGDWLRKGLMWKGVPACLQIGFSGGQAQVALHCDVAPAAVAEVAALAHRMLGLTQPIEVFEDSYREHPVVGRLIALHPGLRLPLTASPFEAVVWAITGQQISVSAALSLRRKLIQTAGIRHSSGLHCHPDSPAILRLDHDQLRAAGFSKSKAAALHEICRRLAAGSLRLDGDDVQQIARQLLDTPGIGPWTVGYALLRGFGWLDGSLHGDVAVRRGLQSLLGVAEKLGEKDVERWLAPFSPWRALVAVHLWAWNRAATN